MKQTRNWKGQFRQIPKISSVYFTTLSKIVISVKTTCFLRFQGIYFFSCYTWQAINTNYSKKVDLVCNLSDRGRIKQRDSVLYSSVHVNGRKVVGYYMLRPFAHSVACFCVSLAVVAQTLKPVKLLATRKRTHQLPTILIVFGQQGCVRLHQA